MDSITAQHFADFLLNFNSFHMGCMNFAWHFKACNLCHQVTLTLIFANISVYTNRQTALGRDVINWTWNVLSFGIMHPVPVEKQFQRQRAKCACGCLARTTSVFEIKGWECSKCRNAMQRPVSCCLGVKSVGWAISIEVKGMEGNTLGNKRVSSSLPSFIFSGGYWTPRHVRLGRVALVLILD